MGGDFSKRRFRPEKQARDTPAYPDVLTGRRAFLQRLGLLTTGALAAPVLVRCAPEYGGTPPIPALQINVAPDHPTLLVGELQHFLAKDTLGLYSDYVPASWTSSDPTIARIDEHGVAEPLAKGSTLIRAEYKDASDETYLKVLDQRIQKLAIEPPSLTLQLGADQPLTAIAHLVGGGQHDMTHKADWSSSDPAVASVASSTFGCRVSTHSSGKVTITATVSTPAPGFSATAELIVT